jgi:hypothetical protein
MNPIPEFAVLSVAPRTPRRRSTRRDLSCSPSSNGGSVRGSPERSALGTGSPAGTPRRRRANPGRPLGGLVRTASAPVLFGSPYARVRGLERGIQLEDLMPTTPGPADPFADVFFQ